MEWVGLWIPFSDFDFFLELRSNGIPVGCLHSELLDVCFLGYCGGGGGGGHECSDEEEEEEGGQWE